MPAVKATKLNIANATSRILELEKRRFISFAPEKLKFDSPCCPGLVMKWAMPPRSQLRIPPGKPAMQAVFQNKTRKNCLFVMFCNCLECSSSKKWKSEGSYILILECSALGSRV